MTRAACGRGGAFSLLITLRQACNRGNFDTAVWDETGSKRRIFGSFSMLAKSLPRSYDKIWAIDVNIGMETYDCCCPLLKMTMPEREMWPFCRYEAKIWFTGCNVAFPLLSESVYLAVDCKIGRENIWLSWQLANGKGSTASSDKSKHWWNDTYPTLPLLFSRTLEFGMTIILGRGSYIFFSGLLQMIFIVQPHKYKFMIHVPSLGCD